MIRNDYIMRLIQQVAEAIARMLDAAERGEVESAKNEAKEAYHLVGVPPELMSRMDSHALAQFCGRAFKIRLLSQIAWKEAEILRSAGDPMNALNLQIKAVELLLEAQRMEPLSEDEANLQEMFRHVPTKLLALRYRQGRQSE
jgi:hypothetical protein